MLNSNKYLSVYSSPYLNSPYENDNNTFLVHFYFPDPLHLNEHVRSLLPDILISKLKTHYKSNDEDQLLFEQQTIEIVKILCIHIFSSYIGISFFPSDSLGGVSHTYSHVQIVNLMFQLSSIGIFETIKLNEQIIQIYGTLLSNSISNVEYGQISGIPSSTFVPLFSNFILLTPIQVYIKHLMDSTLSFNILKSTMILEAITAITHERIPSYDLLPQFRYFIEQSVQQFSSRDRLGGENIQHKFNTNFNKNEQNLIEQHKYIELFDIWFGRNWYSRNIPIDIY
jgi:hypothetical protein